MYKAYVGQIRNGQPVFLEPVTLPEDARLIITALDVEEIPESINHPVAETANCQAQQVTEVKMVSPEVYEDIDKIKENLDKNITSVVNLEKTDEEVAKKIAKYILNDLQTVAQVVRVSDRTFCVAPLGVFITQSRLDD